MQMVQVQHLVVQEGIVFDSSGNLYISDYTNHLIRKMGTSPNYTVTTFAGSGSSGNSDNSTGTSATFTNPFGMTIDISGANIWISDYSSYIIRRISLTSPNAVTTIAGTAGSTGTTNANGSSARFNNLAHITFDTTGNMYIADYTNGLIRRMDTSFNVTTFVTSSASGPYGVAIIANTPFNLYYSTAGSSNNYIKSYSYGTVTTVAGNGTSGYLDNTYGSASFNTCQGIAYDTLGNMFIADNVNDLIRKIVLSTGQVKLYVLFL